MSDLDQQAAALYVAHYPGGDWSKVPEHIKRVYLLAVEAKGGAE